MRIVEPRECARCGAGIVLLVRDLKNGVDKCAPCERIVRREEKLRGRVGKQQDIHFEENREKAKEFEV